MRREYDFKGAKRGPALPVRKGKTRVTIRLDKDVLEWFRKRVHAAGGGSYQTLINDALRTFVSTGGESLEGMLRRLVREELRNARRPARSHAA